MVLITGTWGGIRQIDGRTLLFLILAVFASLTSILGKIGIEGIDSNLGTAIRTTVVLLMAWLMVFVTQKQKEIWHLKGIKRLGIPSVMVIDGPHGLRKQAEGGDHLGINESEKAVCFPAGCATAASFDRELIIEDIQ